MTDVNSKGGMKLNPAVSRRAFLQWGSAIGGTAVASTLLPGGLLRQVFDSDKAKADDAGTWIYSACNMCGGCSGINVNVVDGAVRKIEPNPYNAAGVANICINDTSDAADFVNATTGWGAGMCPKGNSGYKSLYDPDRIKTPMKRDPSSPRGVGAVFNPITWDDALNEITTYLQGLKAEQSGNGAHQLLFFSEDGITGNNPQQDFCKMFGTPNYIQHTSLCDVARKRAFSVPFGDERPVPDFAHAKYALIFGWNFLSATKWSHLPRIARQFFDNGGRMVVVDPVFSSTAAAACRNGGQWVPIKPGTDGALALALANVLINENLYNVAFVNANVIGFQAFSDYVTGVSDGVPKDPNWAEGKTGVPAATIVSLAREIGESSNYPAVIDTWSGPGHHTNGTQGGRAISALLALTGQIGNKGNAVFTNRLGPSARTATNTHDASLSRPRIDGLGKPLSQNGFPLGHGSGIVLRARDVIYDSDLSADDYYAKYPYLGSSASDADTNRPKAAIFVFDNLVMNSSNVQKNIDGLNKLEYIVSIDTHLSETAQMADIILPGANFLERYDFTVNWVTFYSFGLRQPTVSSWVGNPYIDEIGIIMELGRRLGLKGDAGSTAPGDFSMTETQYLGQQLLLNSTIKGNLYPSGDPTNMADCDAALNALKALPGAVWPTLNDLVANVSNWGTKYGTVSKLKTVIGGNQKIVLNSYSGTDAGSGTADAISGYKSLQTAGYDALPVYRDPVDAPGQLGYDGYPFYMVSWKQTEHTHTRTFNNVWLMEMKGTNPCLINKAVADSMGIKNGDAIKIESPIATVDATAFPVEGIEPTTVGVMHGFGHWALGSVAEGKGTAAGRLMPGKPEAISGQGISKEVAVKVYKA